MKNQSNNVCDIDVSSLLAILPKSFFGLFLSIILALGIGLGYALLSSVKQARRFTLVHYQKIKLGMSLTAVQSILDAGNEIKHSTESRVVVCQNYDGSKITVIFTDDKVTHKQQTGF
ncbi:MAG: hypothetical protein QNJ63_13290 [Calothrix sp. MO_192.B10]|nr:hypothetical protein [Calothrix sp. MO_192.B10]